jgi:hypothetical protein
MSSRKQCEWSEQAGNLRHPTGHMEAWWGIGELQLYGQYLHHGTTCPEPSSQCKMLRRANIAPVQYIPIQCWSISQRVLIISLATLAVMKLRVRHTEFVQTRLESLRRLFLADRTGLIVAQSTRRKAGGSGPAPRERLCHRSDGRRAAAEECLQRGAAILAIPFIVPFHRRSGIPGILQVAQPREIRRE